MELPSLGFRSYPAVLPREITRSLPQNFHHHIDEDVLGTHREHVLRASSISDLCPEQGRLTDRIRSVKVRKLLFTCKTLGNVTFKEGGMWHEVIHTLHRYYSCAEMHDCSTLRLPKAGETAIAYIPPVTPLQNQIGTGSVEAVSGEDELIIAVKGAEFRSPTCMQIGHQFISNISDVMSRMALCSRIFALVHSLGEVTDLSSVPKQGFDEYQLMVLRMFLSQHEIDILISVFTRSPLHEEDRGFAIELKKWTEDPIRIMNEVGDLSLSSFIRFNFPFFMEGKDPFGSPKRTKWDRLCPAACRGLPIPVDPTIGFTSKRMSSEQMKTVHPDVSYEQFTKLLVCACTLILEEMTGEKFETRQTFVKCTASGLRLQHHVQTRSNKDDPRSLREWSRLVIPRGWDQEDYTEFGGLHLDGHPPYRRSKDLLAYPDHDLDGTDAVDQPEQVPAVPVGRASRAGKYATRYGYHRARQAWPGYRGITQPFGKSNSTYRKFPVPMDSTLIKPELLEEHPEIEDESHGATEPPGWVDLAGDDTIDSVAYEKDPSEAFTDMVNDPGPVRKVAQRVNGKIKKMRMREDPSPPSHGQVRDLATLYASLTPPDSKGEPTHQIV